MKIGIHKERGCAGLGGAEYSMVVLAEALSRCHDVQLLHQEPWLTREHFTERFAADLSRVQLRHVSPKPRLQHQSSWPWRRYRAARAWNADLSAPYDLFVTFTHGEEPIPFCHAQTGVLVALFPLSERPRRWPSYRKAGSSWRGWLKERVGRPYHEWEWSRRLYSYRVKTCNSHFTRKWTRRLWGIECEVFYPPVDTELQATPKEPRILSVSRFTRMKKQRELVDAFSALGDLHGDGWRFVCAGGAGTTPEDQVYLEDLRKRGAQVPVDIRTNLERSRLKGLLESAKIFWHGAGLGEDEDAHPELAEHFGIATVEAMAAGCVPVVIHKGGQPEIVQHGVNGFLWHTVEDLKQYTRLLARDEAMRDRMAAAARERARCFSKDAYVKRFVDLVTPVLRQPLLPLLEYQPPRSV
jgi:glycosyltransferase involved in cell wall biosynthesis